MHALVILVTAVAGAAAAAYVARQCRRPTWGAGRVVVRGMNASHSALTTWGLSHVEVGRHFTVLDIGCGGGRTIATLAAMATGGKVFGIDYSPASVAVARETNSTSIESGRVEIQGGSASQLPYADQTFDLVTAVETHYYWPDLPGDVREVMRVLKPGATFLIIAETYRGRRHDWLYRPVMQLLLRAAYLTPEQHRQLLSEAGYRDVEIAVEPSHGWISVTGRR